MFYPLLPSLHGCLLTPSPPLRPRASHCVTPLSANQVLSCWWPLEVAGPENPVPSSTPGECRCPLFLMDLNLKWSPCAVLGEQHSIHKMMDMGNRRDGQDRSAPRKCSPLPPLYSSILQSLTHKYTQTPKHGQTHMPAIIHTHTHTHKHTTHTHTHTHTYTHTKKLFL